MNTSFILFSSRIVSLFQAFPPYGLLRCIYHEELSVVELRDVGSPAELHRVGSPGGVLRGSQQLFHLSKEDRERDIEGVKLRAKIVIEITRGWVEEMAVEMKALTNVIFSFVQRMPHLKPRRQ